MCGIFGIDFKPGTVKEGRLALLINVLGHLNDDRGGHSWGAACFDDNGEFQVKKGLGKVGACAYELVGYNRVFGHTRFGTTGARTVENAHPFEIGNVIGAHNGIVYNHRELCNKYKRNYDVDSMHFFGHLAEEKTFSEIEGYGSLEWFYMDDPTNILLSRMRNGDLAMYGVGDDPNNTDGVVWSSREDHLLKALKVAGINNVYRYTLDEGAVYSIREGNVFVTKMRADLSTRSYGGSTCMTWESYQREDDYTGNTGKVSNWRKNRDKSTKGSNFVMKTAEDSAQVFALADKSTLDGDVELVDLDDLKKLSTAELMAVVARGDLDEEDMLELGIITEEQLAEAEKAEDGEIIDETTKPESDSRSIHSVPLSEDFENVNVESGEEWHKFCTMYSRERG